MEGLLSPLHQTLFSSFCSSAADGGQCCLKLIKLISQIHGIVTKDQSFEDNTLKNPSVGNGENPPIFLKLVHQLSELLLSFVNCQ